MKLRKKIALLALVAMCSLSLGLPALAAEKTDKNAVKILQEQRKNLNKELQDAIKALRGKNDSELKRLVSVQGTLQAKSGNTPPAELSVELTKFTPEVKGKNALTAPALKTILAVKVTEQTVLKHFDNKTATLGEMNVGDSLTIVGRFNEDGTLTARLVQDTVVNAPFNLQGTLSAIASTTLPTTLTITLANVGPLPLRDASGAIQRLVGPSITVTVDAQTKITRRFGGKSSLAEFAVGDTISIKGRYAAANSLVATEVRDESIQHAVKKGTVTSIVAADQTIFLNWSADPKIQINASTKITVPGVTNATFADLKVGQRAEVSGVLNTRTHVLAAQSIKVGASIVLPTGVTLQGAVSSLSGATLPATLVVKISSLNPHVKSFPADLRAHLGKEIKVNVTGDTALFDQAWNKINFSAVASGDKVYIGGQLMEDGTVRAVLIKDESIPR